MKSNIIFVSEIFYPSDTSTGYYMTEIASAIAPSYETTAVCARPHDRPDLKGSEHVRGIRVIRIGKMRAPQQNVGFRLARAIFWSAACFVKLIFLAKRGDVIVCVTNPPTVPVIVTLVGLCTGARKVLIVHDVYPHAAIAAGIIKRNSATARMFYRVQRWVLHSQEAIVCIGRDMHRLLCELGGNIEDRISVIPNWAEEAPNMRTCVEHRLRSLKQMGVQQSFVVLYAGNLGRTHDADIILDAARHLPGNVMMLVVANGRDFDLLREHLRKWPSGNIRALELRGKRALQWETLNAGDVVLLTFRAGMSGVSVPSRMYNAMAAGKALIAVADRDSEIAAVINEEDAGWIVEPGDSRRLAQVIEEASRLPDVLKRKGMNARRAASVKYSREASLSRYSKVIENQVIAVMADGYDRNS